MQPGRKPLTADWGPTIFWRDRLYPGRVLVCEKPIEPGKTGEAVIGIMLMTSSPDTIDLEVGSLFELRDGPKDLIATATVLSVVEEKDVAVVRAEPPLR